VWLATTIHPTVFSAGGAVNAYPGWEYELTWYTIRAMAAIGLVWDSSAGAGPDFLRDGRESCEGP